jgi:hypothetical protein
MIKDRLMIIKEDIDRIVHKSRKPVFREYGEILDNWVTARKSKWVGGQLGTSAGPDELPWLKSPHYPHGVGGLRVVICAYNMWYLCSRQDTGPATALRVQVDDFTCNLALTS